MHRCKTLSQFFVLLLFLALLVACQPSVKEEPDVGLANPAAVYCEGLGFTLESRETEAGASAACIFPDGSECNQWDFLSGRCGQEHSYCLQNEGIRMEENGNIATCVFANGSSCGEYEYFLGDCEPAP